MKKIGYLDFTQRVTMGGEHMDRLLIGDDAAFAWWGTIIVEASYDELRALSQKMPFKIVDNISDELYVVSLLCEPFNIIGVRAILKGPRPCLVSDAEVNELDLPWFHLDLSSPERHAFMDTVMANFSGHNTYVLANIATFECLEIMTSDKLKK